MSDGPGKNRPQNLAGVENKLDVNVERVCFESEAS